MGRTGVFLILVFTVACFSQVNGQPKLDSLQHALRLHPKHDSLRIEILNKLAYESYLSDPSIALTYALEAETIADSLNDNRSLAHVYRQLALISWTHADYATALNYQHKGMKLAEEVGDKQLIADLTGNIGLIYNALGNYNEALQFHTRSLSLQRALHNRIRESVALNNIGDVHRHKKDFQRALEYYALALTIRIETKSVQAQATNLRNIGNVYEEMGNYPKALVYYNKSVRLSRETFDKRGESSCLNSMATTSLAQRRYHEAETFAKRALDISLQGRFKAFTRDSYLTLSQLSEATGKANEALHYFKLYSNYKDSVQNLKQATEIAYQQLALETQKHESEVNILKKDGEIIEAELAKKNILITTGVVALIATVAFAIMAYRNYKRQKRITAMVLEKNAEIDRQHREILQQRDELLALNEKIKSQQEEVMTQRDSLMIQNARIATMHEQLVRTNQNLEKLVAERTSFLEKQNAQLIEYSFINAHKLRAPVASVLGLIHLLKIKPGNQDEKLLLDHLNSSAEKLDEVIKSISETLAKGIDLYRPDEDP